MKKIDRKLLKGYVDSAKEWSSDVRWKFAAGIAMAPLGIHVIQDIAMWRPLFCSLDEWLGTAGEMVLFGLGGAIYSNNKNREKIVDKQYLELFEQLKDPMNITTRDGGIEKINPSFIDLTLKIPAIRTKFYIFIFIFTATAHIGTPFFENSGSCLTTRV